jgi:hypothetical protein
MLPFAFEPKSGPEGAGILITSHAGSLLAAETRRDDIHRRFSSN